MYLTRAHLNPRRQGAHQLLTSPQAMHAAVLASFPDQPVPAPQPGGPRVLWRLDTDNPHRPTLWITSPHEPDLTHLIEQAGWPQATTPQWETRPYALLLDRLAKGQRYAFRLTANPTRSVRVADGSSKTRRVEHVTAAHQIRWLIERSQVCGFRLLPSTAALPDSSEPALDLRLLRRDKTRFRRAANTGPGVTVVQVGYEGTLEVDDPDLLRTALTAGIGRARAYGCGLTTLAPLPSRHARANT